MQDCHTDSEEPMWQSEIIRSPAAYKPHSSYGIGVKNNQEETASVDLPSGCLTGCSMYGR